MTDDGFTEVRAAPSPPRSRRLLLIVVSAAVLGGIFVGALLQFVTLPSALNPPVAAPPPPVDAPVAAAPDPLELITPFAGSWQGTNERLTIDIGNGVVQVVRQRQHDDGGWRFDLLAAAPVRVHPAQGLLELDTVEGMWRLALLPGQARTLRIIYADGREMRYE